MEHSRGKPEVPTSEGTAVPAAWERLSREIERCTRCPLARTRTHVVIFRGSPKARVLFVGEAPGAAEDRIGRPFVGASGRRLDAAVAQMGLSANEVGILNLFKCRPANNRFDRRAAAACHPFLERQLGLIHPEWIVTLGAHALAEFAPEAGPVTDAAGRPRKWNDVGLYPMLHPAAMLHNPRLRARWSADVDRFRTLLLGAVSEAL